VGDAGAGVVVVVVVVVVEVSGAFSSSLAQDAVIKPIARTALRPAMAGRRRSKRFRVVMEWVLFLMFTCNEMTSRVDLRTL
jgi:hypothetical protein